jgi:uncharacterized protein YdaU (DUF1376 family)
MDAQAWYRCHPGADYDHARALSLEENGAYVRVLQLMHRRGGAVPDDDRFIADWCGCAPGTWRRIRARLLALDMLYLADGLLRSDRADAQLAEAHERRAAARVAGLASAKIRAAAANEINDLDSTPVGQAADDTPLIARARAESRAEIKARIRELGPYGMQELVAAVLRGAGYAAVTVAAPGPDGGTDVLAWPDALGAATPHVRAQVKHRAERTGRAEIAALRGILRSEREIGLFVSTGGFTREAWREAERDATQITLIDLDAFIDLWIRHQDGLSVADRALLRLVPVHFLDPEPACICHGSAPPGAMLSRADTGVMA